MATRPVPRNIDKPNRTAEYIVAFLVAYYGVMFTVGHPLFAIGMGMLCTYIMYKFTANKPEGMAYRWWYKRFPVGKMLPSARAVKKFEI